MLKLQFKDQHRESIWVVDKTLTIGSDVNNQLVLDDASVSSQHARIARADGGYCICDLGSRGGVCVNQQRVDKQLIKSGDQLAIGGIELLVVDPLAQEDPQRWSLVACSSPLSGKEFAVPEEARARAIKAGRGSHCEMVFPGAHLSREHVQLRIEGDGLKVEDLQSANGTFINDVRITEGELRAGDRLRLDVYNFIAVGPGRRLQARSSGDGLAPSPEQSGSTSQKPDAAANTNPDRRWKTRPTSPGNRSTPSKAKSYNACAIISAVVLCAAVAGLGVYLLLG